MSECLIVKAGIGASESESGKMLSDCGLSLTTAGTKNGLDSHACVAIRVVVADIRDVAATFAYWWGEMLVTPSTPYVAMHPVTACGANSDCV